MGVCSQSSSMSFLIKLMILLAWFSWSRLCGHHNILGINCLLWSPDHLQYWSGWFGSDTVSHRHSRLRPRLRAAASYKMGSGIHDGVVELCLRSLSGSCLFCYLM